MTTRTNETSEDLSSPLHGLFVPLSDVPDPAFASGVLGPGIALEPLSNVIVSPAKGEVINIAKTAHATTIRLQNGAEILIHIGIESVGLNGRGFAPCVKVGQSVELGDPLIEIDLETVTPQVKSLCTPIILLNADKYVWENNALKGVVNHGQSLGSIQKLAKPSPDQITSDPMIGGPEFTLPLRHGLHARPAAKIASIAKQHEGQIQLVSGKNHANAKSVASLMSLGALHGDQICVEANGLNAQSSIDELTKFIVMGAGDEAVSTSSTPKKTTIKERTHKKVKSRRVFKGVTASQGLHTGPIHIHTPIETEIRPPVGTPDEEWRSLQTALYDLSCDIDKKMENLPELERDILQAHLELIDDPEIIARAKAEIKQGRSAGEAWNFVLNAQSELFKNSASKRIRERIADLDDLKIQVLRLLYNLSDRNIPDNLSGTILIADDLNVSEFINYAARGISALCLGAGGATSHVAILAASKGIPALISLGDEVTSCTNASTGILDTSTSTFTYKPSKKEIRTFEKQQKIRLEAFASARKSANQKAVTKDGIKIDLFANLASVKDAIEAKQAGAEGCGLLRTEFLYLNQKTAPTQTEQSLVFNEIFEALGKKPLTIRTLDIAGDKPVPFLNQPKEDNPALGIRGVRAFFTFEDIIREQLRAILRASTGSDISVMFPMVSSLHEIEHMRTILAQEAKKIKIIDLPKLGAMIETPSSAINIDKIIKIVDFVSVGTNDLTQYTLAMDRGHPKLAKELDAFHPAIFWLLDRIGHEAEAAGKPASICGGLASDPVAIPLLLGFGFRRLSCVPHFVPVAKSIISDLDIEACKALSRSSLALNSPPDIRDLVIRTCPQLEVWA